MIREPNTEYVLSLSYGKDSLACLEAIKQLGYPLDRIVHAEVWATDTIPADLPPMVEFKKKADQQILDRYGITVEHICASRAVERERERERVTYEKLFYKVLTTGKHIGTIKGFPLVRGGWCKHLKTGYTADLRRYILSTHQEIGGGYYGFPMRKGNWCTDLKLRALQQNGVNTAQGSLKSEFSNSARSQGATINIVQYLGIAADEPERIKRHTKPGIVLPLVDIGWDEAYCRQWCEENDLLSPIYTTATRGGCWFCHNQGVGQLRLLRKNYPELWALLLKWDADSPVTFHPDGRTVADFDKRFQMEDDGLIKAGDKKFRWKQVFPEERKDNTHENYPES